MGGYDTNRNTFEYCQVQYSQTFDSHPTAAVLPQTPSALPLTVSRGLPLARTPTIVGMRTPNMQTPARSGMSTPETSGRRTPTNSGMRTPPTVNTTLAGSAGQSQADLSIADLWANDIV